MNMFSNCSGSCCICACTGYCLAGHGDDDFVLADKTTLVKRLIEQKYKDSKDFQQKIIDALKNNYNCTENDIYDLIRELLEIKHNSLIREFNGFQIDMNTVSCNIGVKILTMYLTEDQKNELLNSLKEFDSMRNEWFCAINKDLTR